MNSIFVFQYQVGPNILLARVATKIAKPNGWFQITNENSSDQIGRLSIRDIPGVGWKLEKKFKELGINNGDELKKMSPKVTILLLLSKKVSACYPL